MERRQPTLAELALPGLLAGLLFSAAALAFGRRDSGSAAAALNAPSHVIWGEPAFAERRYTIRHTLPGLVINTGAGLFWAALMQTLLRRGFRPGLAGALMAGAATSSLAWLVDYHLIPGRLSPGVQERVTGNSLLAIHTLFALGLGIGAHLAMPERGGRPAPVTGEPA